MEKIGKGTRGGNAIPELLKSTCDIRKSEYTDSCARTEKEKKD